MQPAGIWEADVVRGPHDVRFESADLPSSIASNVELVADVAIRNESWRTLKSDGVAHPVFLSYRWLDRQRRPIVEVHITRLGAEVLAAFEPEEETVP